MIDNDEQTMEQGELRRALLLARVGGHLTSLDLEPTLETAARAALPLLGEVCAVDRLAGPRVMRLLEVRSGHDGWLEPPEELAAVAGAEVRAEGARCRLTVPLFFEGKRLGTLSFVAVNRPPHTAEDVRLAQDLGDRIARAMTNADAYRHAKQAAADREQLLYVVAHELRTPLTSLRLCVDSMRRNDQLATMIGRQLDLLDRDGRKMARLVDDLIDVARIRSGQLHLELGSVDLREVIAEVGRRLAGEVARAGCLLAIEDGPPVVGTWDRARIDQVVTNLLTNALKFGPHQPVEIAVHTTAARARLTVTDHGPGIPPEVQRRIFDAFERAVGAGQPDGLGLGLFIVRTIVTRLGGAVTVDSAPGHGATFTVELPVDATVS
jgi:signal transduction histidine kinase